MKERIPSRSGAGCRVRSLRMVASVALLAAAACADDSAPSSEGATALPSPDAPLDTLLAAVGERDFRSRACIACHKVGEGRFVGPDLAGVTRRRSYEWFRSMVANPDSMIRNDSTATALWRQFATPMTDQRAKPGQIRSIWEYLRRVDAAHP